MMPRLKRLLSTPLALLGAACMPVVAWYAQFRHGANSSLYVLFPQPPNHDSRRLASAGRILPDPSARACIRSSVNTEGWIEQTATIPAEAIRNVTLRLPAQYVARTITFPADQAAPMSDHVLGLWDVSHPQTGAPPRYEQRLGLWINSYNGYPTVGAPPGTEQSDFSECQVTVADQTMFLTEFTLRSALGQDTYYVAAVWPAGRAGWVTGLGSGPTRAVQAELRAALETVRFVRK